ncbi:hypothetical protein RI367_005299 [Sorochytrium milnesiophthora]
MASPVSESSGSAPTRSFQGQFDIQGGDASPEWTAAVGRLGRVFTGQPQVQSLANDAVDGMYTGGFLQVMTSVTSSLEVSQAHRQPGCYAPAMARIRTRTSNPHEWAVIRRFVADRQSATRLAKVTAHIDIFGNELTGNAAMTHQDLPATLHFLGMAVNADPRLFLRDQDIAPSYAELPPALRARVDLKTMNWAVTTSAWSSGSKTSTLFTSLGPNISCSFRLKVVAGTLPTRHRVDPFWPLRHTDGTCARYQLLGVERPQDVRRCPRANQAFADSVARASDYLTNVGARQKGLPRACGELVGAALAQLAQQYPTREHLPAGCVPASFVSAAKRVLPGWNCSQTFATPLSAKFVDRLAQGMYDHRAPAMHRTVRVFPPAPCP